MPALLHQLRTTPRQVGFGELYKCQFSYVLINSRCQTGLVVKLTSRCDCEDVSKGEWQVSSRTAKESPALRVADTWVIPTARAQTEQGQRQGKFTLSPGAETPSSSCSWVSGFRVSGPWLILSLLAGLLDRSTAPTVINQILCLWPSTLVADFAGWKMVKVSSHS